MAGTLWFRCGVAGLLSCVGLGSAVWKGSLASTVPLGRLEVEGEEAVIFEFPRNSTARYFSVVGLESEGWPADAWVFTKDAVPGHQAAQHGVHVHTHEHDRLSVYTGCAASLVGPPRPRATSCFAAEAAHVTDFRSSRDKNWAHNTAWLMEEGSLFGLGGRDGRRSHSRLRRGRDGVYLRSFTNAKTFDENSASVLNASLYTLEPQGPPPTSPIFYGNHSACTERRPQFAPNCEFDGRFSLVRRRGDVFVYARANIIGEASELGHFGGRYVQVAKAPSLRGPWGPFRLLEIPRFHKWSREANIYFASVTLNPADSGRTLLALFPVRHIDFAVIAIAVTCDAVHFSPLHVLANSTDAGEGRTTDHPADGLIVRGDTVFFFLHRNVPGIADKRATSKLTRIAVKLDVLKKFTDVHYPGGCDPQSEPPSQNHPSLDHIQKKSAARHSDAAARAFRPAMANKA